MTGLSHPASDDVGAPVTAWSTLRTCLSYALWLALAVTLGDLALRSVRQLVVARELSDEYLWRMPEGYLVIYLALGLACTACLRWTSRRTVLLTLLAVGTLIGVTSWLFLFSSIHKAAAIVLAAGVSVQTTRLAARRPGMVQAFARGTAAWLAVVALAPGIGAFAWASVKEARTLSSLGPSRAGAPNVLLLVLDTVRADSLSLYGYDRPTTPSLERLAEKAVVFTDAYSTAPWTLPSHGSMFTGRFPSEQSSGYLTPMDGRFPTLAEALSRDGYVTAGFVANLRYARRGFGLERGFVHYEGRPESVGTAITATTVGEATARTLGLAPDETLDGFGLKDATTVSREALAWLDRRSHKGDRPFFVFINYADAHAPYASPKAFREHFAPEPPTTTMWSRPLRDWSAADIRRFRDAYDAAIAYIDDEIGRFLQELERRGDLRNTVVIITSDHGEQFGERGLLEHASSLYDPLLHVPLIIAFPGAIPAGKRIDQFVSLRDLPATVGDLTGARELTGFPGTSWSRTWRQEPGLGADIFVAAETSAVGDPFPVDYPARFGALRSIIGDGFQYIWNEKNFREELYDERTAVDGPDLAAARPDVVSRYRNIMRQMLPGTVPRPR